MRLTQLTEKTGNELSSKGYKYLKLLTTVTRDNKQYDLYEPTQDTGKPNPTISELLRQKGNNKEVYICL